MLTSSKKNKNENFKNKHINIIKKKIYLKFIIYISSE